MSLWTRRRWVRQSSFVQVCFFISLARQQLWAHLHNCMSVHSIHMNTISQGLLNLSSQERRMMYWLEIGRKAKATVTLHILGRNSRIHTMSYCDDTQKVQGEHHHDIKMFYRNYFPTIIQHHNSGTEGGFVIMFHTDLVDAHLGRPPSSCAAGMKMCVMRRHFRIPHEHKVYFSFVFVLL